MITLHESNITSFPLDNGIGVLRDAVKAFAEEELNGIFEFEMEYDSEGHLVDELKEERIIKAKAQDKLGYQLFRIYSITKNHENDNLIIKGQHITYDLANNFIKELEANNMTKQQVMQLIGTSAVTPHTFNLTSPNNTTRSTTKLYRTNPLQMIGGMQGSVLQIWGGQIERDNFNLILHDKRGHDDGVTVTYEKNITGLEAVFDISNVITRIFPFVFKEATENEPEKLITITGEYIDSSLINNYKIIRTQPIDFSSDDRINLDGTDAQIRTQLTNLANAYFDETGNDRAKVELDVNFAHLWETEEYKDVAPLELVGMGDTVTINHSKLKVYATATVNYIRYDCIAQVNEEVKLGSVKARLSDKVNKVEEAIQKVEQIESNVNQVIVNIGGKNKTFYGPDEPTSEMQKGDLWFKVVDGEYTQTYRYDGIEWQLIVDMGSQKAKAEAEEAKQSAQAAVDRANQAKAEAESAISKANESFGKAENALASSSMALQQSADAYDKSLDAFDKAEDGLTQANTALNKAQEGFNLAQENAEEIEGIGLRIGDVEEDFTTISGNIQGLQTQVGNIAGDLSTVTQTANANKTDLQNARGDINTLTQTATALQNRLSDAEGNINTITNLATGTQQTVSNLQGSFTQLSTTVNGLQTEVGKKVDSTTYATKMTQLDNAISQRVTKTDANNLYTQKTEFNQFADGFSQRVDAIEGWEIGGRNILVNGDFSQGFSLPSYWALWSSPGNTLKQTVIDDEVHGSALYLEMTGTSSYVRNMIGDYFKDQLTIGEYVTISFFAKGTSSMTTIHLGSTGGNSYSITEQKHITDISSEWKKYAVTLRVTSNTTDRDTSWGFRFNVTPGELYVTKIMIVKGNKAFDYQPAPEDTDQKFSSITQTIDNIDQRVQTNASNYSSISQTVQGIQNEVNKKVDDTVYNSKMTQLDNAIQARITTATADGRYATKTALTLTETSFTTEINKKVDTTTYTSKINQIDTAINLRVKEGDVLSQINIEANRTLIQSNKLILDADTVTVTGTFRVNNANISSVDAGKMTTGTLNAAQVNIINMNASNIKTGTLVGIDIQGARFYSSAKTDWMEIVGGNIKLTKSNGQTVEINPDGLISKNANGTTRFEMDRYIVRSNALAAYDANVYLAPRGAINEARVVSESEIAGGTGAIEDYTYRDIRAKNFIGDGLYANYRKGVTHLELRPAYNNGEVRIYKGDESTSPADIRGAGFYGHFINVNGHIGEVANLYIRPHSETRFTKSETTDVYTDIRADGVYASHLTLNGHINQQNLYVRAFNEIRATAVDSTTKYISVRADGFYGNSLNFNTSVAGANMYMRMSSTGSLYVTRLGNDNARAAVYAASFNESSSREYKTDITTYTGNALDVINKLQVVNFRMKDDVANGVDDVKIGFIAEDSEAIATLDKKAIQSYKIGAYNTKAIQELDLKLDLTREDLVMKIAELEQRINELERAA